MLLKIVDVCNSNIYNSLGFSFYITSIRSDCKHPL